MAGTNPIFSNQAWRPLHVRDCFLFERGSTKAFAGVTTVNLGLGANSNPGAFPDVPAVIAIAHDFGEASQPGNIHSIDVEQLFSFAGSTSVTANGNGAASDNISILIVIVAHIGFFLGNIPTSMASSSTTYICILALGITSSIVIS